MHRVLRPKGRCFVTSWVPFDRSPVISALFDAMHEAMPGMPFGAGKAPLGELSEMEAELREAGFDAIQTQTITHTMSLPSVEAFWESMLKSLAPMVLMRHRMGDGFQPFADKVFANLKRLMPEGSVEAEMTANLGIGTKS